MIRYLAMATLIFALGAQSGVSDAAGADCRGAISVQGVAAFVDGSADFEHYQGKVPAGLARGRAIAAWQKLVANACPGYSNKWWRAKAATVTCEGATGHEYCAATATPVRKLFTPFQH